MLQPPSKSRIGVLYKPRTAHWKALRDVILSTLEVSLLFHSVNSSSHSINGDIAIQWEWPKFDPSWNPNPLTDYDDTLHKRLLPRDDHVGLTQTLCQWPQWSVWRNTWTAYPHSFWFSCTFVWFAALEVWVDLSLFKIYCYMFEQF